MMNINVSKGKVMGKVVVFGNQKGGCGKTTLAITLACGLKEQGFSVLMVDADPQGSVMSWAGRVEENSENVLPDTEKHDNVLIDQGFAKSA
jgi:chromosome partitioning protein